MFIHYKRQKKIHHLVAIINQLFLVTRVVFFDQAALSLSLRSSCHAVNSTEPSVSPTVICELLFMPPAWNEDEEIHHPTDGLRAISVTGVHTQPTISVQFLSGNLLSPLSSLCKDVKFKEPILYINVTPVPPVSRQWVISCLKEG